MQSLLREIREEFNKFYPDISKKLTHTQMLKLATFVDDLIKWNQKTNLIGKNTPSEIFNELIIDSLYLKEAILTIKKRFQKNIFKFLDVGCGAGIPGIPFRIVYENGEYLMVERRKKRAIFVSYMTKKLKLKNTKVLMKNIEQVCGIFEIVLSRAFCPWRDFLTLSKKYLNPKGLCVVFSNSQFKNEKLNDFLLLDEFSYKIKNEKFRYLWLFEKKAPS